MTNPMDSGSHDYVQGRASNFDTSKPLSLYLDSPRGETMSKATETYGAPQTEQATAAFVLSTRPILNLREYLYFSFLCKGDTATYLEFDQLGVDSQPDIQRGNLDVGGKAYEEY